MRGRCFKDAVSPGKFRRDRERRNSDQKLGQRIQPERRKRSLPHAGGSKFPAPTEPMPKPAMNIERTMDTNAVVTLNCERDGAVAQGRSLGATCDDADVEGHSCQYQLPV